MPPAETLIGKCQRNWYNVCTYRANFHFFLSTFGKTNILDDPNELQYINSKSTKKKNSIDIVPTKRRIFLYEINQLNDPDPTRELQFRYDLQQYLRLQKPIDPFIRVKPGKNITDPHHVQLVENNKIDICTEQYDDLRSILMPQAINASKWIRQYFINAKDVYVSSSEYFATNLMKSWELDPCIERIRVQQQQQKQNQEMI